MIARNRSGARGGRPAAILVGLMIALCAVLLAASACAELPTSSSPQALGTVQRDAGVADVPTPTPGKEPDLLVRDFLKASSEPGGRHSAARKFLTDSASKDWDDSTSTSIIDKIDVFFDSRSADAATLLISAAKVGRLDDSGTFRAEEGTLEARVSMVRENGEWRIDELPDGVMIDRSEFLNTYHQVQLFFLAPDGETVVTDPRWLSLRVSELASQLISMLVSGPNSTLADSVVSRFGPEVHLRSTLTKIDGRDSNVGVGLGGVKMDFQGIGGLPPQERTQFAAQIVWTLSSAGIAGPYEILADGAPLDPQFADGYTTEDVAGFDPAAAGENVGLHGIDDGALVAMADSGPVPVPGPLGRSDSLLSASLSRDGTRVAAVGTSDVPPQGGPPGVTLLVGEYGGAAPTAVTGREITRPTWGLHGDVWVAVDGESVQRVAVDPDDGEAVGSEQVDVSDITKIGGPITSLRISVDGVRAAVVVDGRVFVALITRTHDGGYALRAPQAVGYSLSDDIVSIDWDGTGSIRAVESGSDASPVVLSVDGFSVHSMSSRNLAPPLSLISATDDAVYVVDSRGVMRRPQGGQGDELFWREVPGLMGEGKLPVTQG